jgi:hypothetical protein
MAALADLEENSMPLGDVEQLVDTETLHGSRSLDLEERRRRVCSQVGFLTLVEWCLACGQNVMSSTSSAHELHRQVTCILRPRFVLDIIFSFSPFTSMINVTGMGIASIKQWFGWDLMAFKIVCQKPPWAQVLM